MHGTIGAPGPGDSVPVGIAGHAAAMAAIGDADGLKSPQSQEQGTRVRRVTAWRPHGAEDVPTTAVARVAVVRCWCEAIRRRGRSGANGSGLRSRCRRLA